MVIYRLSYIDVVGHQISCSHFRIGLFWFSYFGINSQLNASINDYESYFWLRENQAI